MVVAAGRGVLTGTSYLRQAGYGTDVWNFVIACQILG
jgi:hypothetical protein